MALELLLTEFSPDPKLILGSQLSTFLKAPTRLDRAGTKKRSGNRWICWGEIYMGNLSINNWFRNFRVLNPASNKGQQLQLGPWQ
jgi:hypothetical protein